jgi:hypothetical protein
MTAAPRAARNSPAVCLISMHAFGNGAPIRCMDGVRLGTGGANPLIAFDSSRVAQPVLVSEPDPGTPNANQQPVRARDVSR